MKGESTGAAKHVVHCYRERKGLRVEGRGQAGGEERHTERESKEREKSVTGNDDGAVWESRPEKK